MSTTAFEALAAKSGSRTTLPGWLREPLLHFLVLGGLLFAVDHVIFGQAEDQRVILIGAKVDSEAKEVFRKARGREPNADELYALRRVWLDNEVLYREGLAMQLDKGDPSIRDRVIFKALSVIDAGVKRPPFDDKVLRTWFESNRARYDQPARYNYQEAVLSGDKSDPALHSFVVALNAGTPGEDVQAGLRVFKDRPLDNLLQSYGREFVDALDSSRPGEWRALPSREGLRAMRLESITPPVPAVFEDLRGVVLHDWTDAMLAEQRSAAVRALAKKYTVKVVDAGQ